MFVTAQLTAMIDMLIALAVVGFIGYIVVTYVPMVEPVRSLIIVGFALFAALYVLRWLGHGGELLAF
jgi:hypothetical protein